MMKRSVDITNRQELRNLLQQLKPDTMALWGKMKPQQMVEHLVKQVEYTNGKRIPTCDKSPEEAARRKELVLRSAAEMPRNIILGELSEHYEFPDLETAIGQLLIELKAFDRYFEQPGATAIHGGFGPLNHEEWLIWHGKHFTHHFKQFGLIQEE